MMGRHASQAFLISIIATVAMYVLGGIAPAFAQPFDVINPNDAGAGSLRQAILDANANPGPDTIRFDIPGAGPHVIQPLSNLPHISDSVDIDGYTQPGSSLNSAANGSNAIIKVVLDGSSVIDFSNGIIISAPDTTITGLAFVNWGGVVFSLHGEGARVVGNWFGVAPDNSAAPNGIAMNVFADDIRIGSSSEGSTTLGDRNLISNSTGWGVIVHSVAGNTIIMNNWIGTDPSANLPMGNRFGFSIQGTDTQIGGFGPLEENVVAWSRLSGIRLLSIGGPAENVTIRGNRIYNNGELGIDLASDGVTENDEPENLDMDSGANGLQNFPILSSATEGGGSYTIMGWLDSAQGTIYDIDFYSNSNLDAGPPDNIGLFHGEGESYLGTTQVTTNVMGHADFNVMFAASVVGPWISATATDPGGNTSEFSTTIGISGEICNVTNTDPSGPNSFDGCLDQVANNGNNDSEVDRITFNVPGGGTLPHNENIAPFSPNLELDFSTQPGYAPPPLEGDPCDEAATLPVIIDAGGIDIFLPSGIQIIGMNLMGSVVIPPDASGVHVTDSRITATLPGPGMFLEGDLNAIFNTVIHSGNNEAALDLFGNRNWIGQTCLDGSPGVTVTGQPPDGAQLNTLLRTAITTVDPTAIQVLGGSGHTFSRIRGQIVPPGRPDGPSLGVTIDLGGDGHTENDPLDADEGANDLQNHPVIESANTIAGASRGTIQSRVEGVLDSEPNTDYRIEAYAASACAANDYGPAERYLGFVEVTTDDAGHTDFLLESDAAVVKGEVVVATATGPFGSTSELSACVTVVPGAPGPIFESGFE